MSGEIILTCKDLTLGYENITLAEGVSFTVSEGEYWCITGENGTGKTTLMKTILGLTKPLAGNVEWNGTAAGTGIGYLPQQTDVQRDFPASVYEVVLSGCQGRLGMRPFYNRSDRDLALLNMKRMGIDDISKRCYRELSGGQQQRALLARALCATGKVLVLDEPVAALDPKATEEMYELITSLNKEDGITIIMVTHDPEAPSRYATHELRFGQEVTTHVI
ncbi:zinc transport system ATP-binding protein [Ruminococcaceae bacterium YRB3002]|nr:zinc transport system ATP-binding protein [Ruminococcaceae bacterium YRB3002]